jgi:hypothetical protein
VRIPAMESVDKSHKLPFVYWICVLWSSLQKLFDRTAEAVGVLENVFTDMEVFCRRHPESVPVRQLMAVAAHNLSVECLKSNDVLSALQWAHKLLEIVQFSNVDVPESCHRIIAWAETAQQRIQTLGPKVMRQTE